ncbi:MAG: SUMF1/EgtB/PvdO family nonheme iron enzyme [Bacteroidetes bacterium]|nr:SUMF1/EgtB/PvdO family nonheme iron enzyme [Bacteroidota bacterium]
MKNNLYSMVLIKGGTFEMGNDSLTTEMRSHKVTVGDYYLSRYEVTQKQWQDIMGENPSHFVGCGDCPVENVSAADAELFIKKLNTKTGGKYRLPTEAEWEYAARGGNASKGYTFSGSSNIDEVAWHDNNSDNETHPVGQKKANELGLHDMTGNVFEWCGDRFSYTYYKDGPSSDPHGSDQGVWRVLRGGSWSHGEKECLPAHRGKDEPTNRGRRTGFRLAADK